MRTQVLERYEAMKQSLPEGSTEQMELQRILGLKVEELRGRYSMLVKTLIEDE